jgi:ABC-type enterobactin transport system permease subunit
MLRETITVRLSPDGRRLLRYVVEPIARQEAEQAAGEPDPDGWIRTRLPVESPDVAYTYVLSLGPDAAAARGVDVPRAQRLAFFSASLATSAAVSLAGPIGFIGIVVPHLVRLLVGVDHRIVLPASALVGAAFLVLCDLGARTLIAPVEIPVGVVTAMIGGPFFLWLLVRRG